MTIFYYAVCVVGNRWSPTGQMSPEPLRVEGREPLGKEPEWCCAPFKRVVEEGQLLVKGHYGDRLVPDIRLGSQDREDPAVRFCPFCAAHVLWEHNLDLRVVESTYTPEPRMVNHYEVAELDCSCYFDCRNDSHTGHWHQHEEQPCAVHPDAVMVG